MNTRTLPITIGLVSILIGVSLVGAQDTTASVHALRAGCPQVAAVVVAPSGSELREACRAIGQAADFLAAQGISVRAPVELHLVDALPAEAATATRTGVYLHESRRAYVLQRSHWPQDAAPFGLPMTPELYRSAIVHEAVHAIVADHFRNPHPDVVVHEYFAYVGQLHSLAPALRERALEEAGPVPAEDLARRLNLFVLGMNPDRFAAIAWKHWSRRGNDTAFVHALLDGNALPAG